LKNISRNRLFATISRFVSLVIADNEFGFNKEQWDSDNDMWKFKEFEEHLAFVKVIFMLQM
jgi:hypothetical protein